MQVLYSFCKKVFRYLVRLSYFHTAWWTFQHCRSSKWELKKERQQQRVLKTKKRYNKFTWNVKAQMSLLAAYLLIVFCMWFLCADLFFHFPHEPHENVWCAGVLREKRLCEELNDSERRSNKALLVHYRAAVLSELSVLSAQLNKLLFRRLPKLFSPSSARCHGIWGEPGTFARGGTFIL